MGINYYSEILYQRAEAVGTALRERNWRLATAESCTGGGLGHALTAVPGSSGWYLGGVVSYSNEFKQDFLGVSEVLLQRHGAVSSEVAGAMAVGMVQRSGVEVALAVTGIAGPDGDSTDKPIGLVWLACLDPEWGLRTVRLNLEGTRDHIRREAIAAAMDFFLQGL